MSRTYEQLEPVISALDERIKKTGDEISESKEDLTSLEDSLDELCESGCIITFFDFNWTSGEAKATGVDSSSDSYFYSAVIPSDIFMNGIFNTSGLSTPVEVWATDSTDLSASFSRRSNIPYGESAWEPSDNYLNGKNYARLNIYYQEDKSTFTLITKEKALALDSELKEVENIVEGNTTQITSVATKGGLTKDITFDWEVGDIDSQGQIQPSSTSLYHSGFISRDIFEGATFDLTSIGYIYGYKNDGTFLSRASNLPAGITTIPKGYLGNREKVRVVVDARYYSASKASYVDKTLPTYADLSFSFLSIEKPYYFISSIPPTEHVYFSFESIVYTYDGNVYTKSFADLNTDTGIPITAYNDAKVSNLSYIIKTDGERNQIKIDPELNKFVAVKSDKSDDTTIICVNLDTGIVTGPLVEAYHAYVHSDMFKVQNDIPLSVKYQLDNKASTLYGLYDDSTFLFAYLSDCHMYGFLDGVETNLTGLATNRFDEHMSFDMILNCGDSVLSNSNYTDDGSAYIALAQSAFETDRKKTLYVEGNHDRNIIEPIMPIKDFVNLMYREIKRDPNVHFGKENGAYYYVDYPDYKIRVIVLTMYDLPNDTAYNDNAGYKYDQMEWLANTALDLDSDWHVIVASHTTPILIHDNNPAQNDNVLKKILEDFVGGTSSTINSTSTNQQYTSYTINTAFTTPGNLIGFFSGHVHYDNKIVTNGVTYVSINCGYIDGNQISVREGLTYSAICFDVAIVDTTNRTVTLKRVGYGSDRNWTY